jgi:hypothetical protein
MTGTRSGTWRALVWLPCLLAACAAPPAPAPAPLPIFTPPPPAPPPLTSLYESAVRAAAVRDPSFAVKLLVLPAKPYVTLVNFSGWGAPQSPTVRPVWTSDPKQLAALCKGKPDAVLAIEEALGLPPKPQPDSAAYHWQINTILVPTADLFRPCPGGTSITAGVCGDMIAPRGNPYFPKPGTIDPTTAYFLLSQIWSSSRIGFTTTSGTPDWGYPFTGMGWTYNWDPAAPSPIGVTEFVIRLGSTVTTVATETPREFCAV